MKEIYRLLTQEPSCAIAFMVTLFLMALVIFILVFMAKVF